MRRRRGNREGSIFQRGDGRWCGELYLGRKLGGGKKVSRFYGTTQGEVRQKITAASHDRQRGILTDPSRETVAQFLERWLRDSAAHSVRPRTFECYAGSLRKHAIPWLGRRRLTKLEPGHLRELYAAKLAAGLAPRTVQIIHAVLHRALKQATRDGLVPRNVAELVDRPRVSRRTMQVLSPAQAAAFLEAARADRLHALYVLALTTGMRQGELLGLAWPAVDLDAGVLQVLQQLQRARGREVALSEPKSAAGRRLIELPQIAVLALREHRLRQLQERLALGAAWATAWDLVFTTEIGSPLDASNLVRASFLPLLTRAELPRIRFHDLRHTAATLLLAAGEHPKVVQERLGHSSIALTLDTYSHVLPSMQKAAAAKIDAILASAGGQ